MPVARASIAASHASTTESHEVMMGPHDATTEPLRREMSPKRDQFLYHFGFEGVISRYPDTRAGE
jgi:hypothetical protein